MVKERVVLERPERFSKPHEIPREKLERAARAACDKMKAFAKSHDMLKFPATCSKDFKYDLRDDIEWWESGMYTGCYWLAYELTGDGFFREIAEKQLPTFKERMDAGIAMNNHDVGFIFVPSLVAAWKLTGNEWARDTALAALEYYHKTSYSEKGKFIIRSWKSWDKGWGCRTMMDSMMNAPVLFWGGVETGKAEYTAAGRDQTKTTETYLIREDGSSFHHYQFDPETAGPVKGVTLQGNSDDSCWSRGHSWGVYGFPIAYSYCKEDFQREVHRDITYFMLNHLPDDMIPYWDYDFTSGDHPRDTSAGAIAVCGMLEMCKYLPDDSEEKAIFESAAAQMLEAIIDDYTGDIGVEYDGLIHHVTHAKPQGQGIDECAVYGDYFYLEALHRYLNPDKFIRFW